VTTSTSSATSGPSKTSKNAIIGGTIGGVGLLAIGIIIGLFRLRQRQRRPQPIARDTARNADQLSPEPYPYNPVTAADGGYHNSPAVPRNTDLEMREERSGGRSSFPF
jgi:hypothetical protein